MFIIVAVAQRTFVHKNIDSFDILSDPDGRCHVNELKRQLKEANNTILQLRSELSKAKKDDSLAVKGKWVEL